MNIAITRTNTFSATDFLKFSTFESFKALTGLKLKKLEGSGANNYLGGIMK